MDPSSRLRPALQSPSPRTARRGRRRCPGARVSRVSDVPARPGPRTARGTTSPSLRSPGSPLFRSLPQDHPELARARGPGGPGRGRRRQGHSRRPAGMRLPPPGAGLRGLHGRRGGAPGAACDICARAGGDVVALGPPIWTGLPPVPEARREKSRLNAAPAAPGSARTAPGPPEPAQAARPHLALCLHCGADVL